MTTDISVPQLIDSVSAELRDAVLAIQQPRTDFEISHFVVGQHESQPRQWAQCTLELQNKIQNLRRAQVTERQIKRRIERLEERGTPAALDKAELLRIDLEDQSLAVIGAIREVTALLSIWKSFPKTYTREELNAAEVEYWHKRLTRQASQDINAYGRIGVGNQDAMRQAGIPFPASPNYIEAVERRMLDTAMQRVLVVTPTLIPRETIERDGLRCLDGWSVPGTVQHRHYCVVGRPIAAAYTDAVFQAQQHQATHILCVEDDMIIPADAFDRLWKRMHECGPRAIVGAWYPQRRHPRTGTPIVLRDSRREYLDDDGAVHEVLTIPQGFTLIPMGVFSEAPQPWFATTGCISQDSFFSQVARDHGWRLIVDTSIKCKHVDRESGEVFE